MTIWYDMDKNREQFSDRLKNITENSQYRCLTGTVITDFLIETIYGPPSKSFGVWMLKTIVDDMDKAKEGLQEALRRKHPNVDLEDMDDIYSDHEDEIEAIAALEAVQNMRSFLSECAEAPEINALRSQEEAAYRDVCFDENGI